ncbi:MAG: RdgB/HAM1 family non-canonical purine NTP pyrophosphatase [Chromatiales bacterium]|nr:RdgB/HAM1 family non-canonical purine NTP pyrophosphatase [Chromatiales bacterium]
MACRRASVKPRLVVASGNRGKLAELRALLSEHCVLLPQDELGVQSVEETGATFTENALLKARHAAAVTGLPALADDSGLEVEALGGAPGVISARFAGPGADDAANNDRLLAELASCPPGRRHAVFRCVLALVRSASDPEPLLVEGIWRGRIAGAPRGTGGFGYDPLFIDTRSGLTAAELAPEEKNRRSHRGQAVRLLAVRLSYGGFLPGA